MEKNFDDVGADGRSKRDSKGYDAGKRIKGHKSHILTDTGGRFLTLRVYMAGT